MKILLKASKDILGCAESSTARTDPPMGCGEVSFNPSAEYIRVEALFRQKTRNAGILSSRDEAKLSGFHLALSTDYGEIISPVGFTISDYREELPDEPLTLEFWGIPHEQFERLFPGHYEAYVSSFQKT